MFTLRSSKLFSELNEENSLHTVLPKEKAGLKTKLECVRGDALGTMMLMRVGGEKKEKTSVAVPGVCMSSFC